MQDLKFLKPGGTLGICAPSGGFDPEKFDLGCGILNKMGFQVIVPDGIYQKKRYLAGDDHSRAKIVNQLFSDPDIDGIICARGGYGAMRILEYLDWPGIIKNPKPFIGFSDITAMLLAITAATRLPVIHGPTVLSLADTDEKTISSFMKILTGQQDFGWAKQGRSLIQGTGTGIFLGGNLSTISHLMGTRYQPDFSDAVLFFEDIGEPAYKIDRMLSQMKLAGLFDKVKGVVLGVFENCSNHEYLDTIFYEIFSDLHVPVLSAVPAGHCRVNHSFLLGTRVSLDTIDLSLEYLPS